MNRLEMLRRYLRWLHGWSLVEQMIKHAAFSELGSCRARIVVLKTVRVSVALNMANVHVAI